MPVCCGNSFITGFECIVKWRRDDNLKGEQQIKNQPHYTRLITPKRDSGGAYLRGLAPGQHSYEET